ncbi:MAG: hypothetical protein KDD42_02460 [Bdellovibrionales bacterium]|nr:hypothetical protein [Bdellovibrionales bacterium]
MRGNRTKNSSSGLMLLAHSLIGLLVSLCLPVLALGDPLTQEEAIAKAEEFIMVNGYTGAPSSKIKPELDLESVEWGNSRNEILKARLNSLKPRAIGIRKGAGGGPGWSVAFDYVNTNKNPAEQACRIVTMNPDGEKVRMQHADAFRNAFAGFALQ